MLEKLDGTPIPGRFSARRLRRFIYVPREGTKLAEEQAEVEKRMADENNDEEDERHQDEVPEEDGNRETETA